MAHFAQLNDNNEVIRVIVVDNKELIDPENGNEDESLGIAFCRRIFGGNWKKTSYNTRSGIYYNPETDQPSKIQSKAFRKNYAGVGYTYDELRDAFIPPKPYNSWILNETTCQWEPPIPFPMDGKGSKKWDESIQNWVLMQQ